MHRILLIHGPNLMYLGKRNPEKYGTRTAADIDAMCREHAGKNGYELEIFYTNHEGAVIEKLHEAFDRGVDGLVMNPASLAHASHGVRACMQDLKLPYVEVHMSNVTRQDSRSILAPFGQGVVHGFGPYSYLLGLDAMLLLLDGRLEVMVVPPRSKA